VLCPDGAGTYRVGEVTGEYFYRPGEHLPHRRNVRWLSQTIRRDEMSEPLRNATGSIGTVANISGYVDEIERLLGDPTRAVVSTDPSVEDPSAFAMEKHLEDFLVQNWAQTELGRTYDIYTVDGEAVGQQYPTDTGPLDILAISKDQKTLLVVELKKGRASDVVVGQTLRYMGFVQEELAEEGQIVRAPIIALEDDPRIRRALSMVPSIELFRYQISFKLVKA
jgi:restriction system protein